MVHKELLEEENIKLREALAHLMRGSCWCELSIIKELSMVKDHSLGCRLANEIFFKEPKTVPMHLDIKDGWIHMDFMANPSIMSKADRLLSDNERVEVYDRENDVIKVKPVKCAHMHRFVFPMARAIPKGEGGPNDM